MYDFLSVFYSNFDFKNAVTLKTGLGVRQGHWKYHHSIERPCVFHTCTQWVTKGTLFLPILWPILGDLFQNSVIFGLSIDGVTNLSIKIPPHLKRVVTQPCETLVPVFRGCIYISTLTHIVADCPSWAYKRDGIFRHQKRSRNTHYHFERFCWSWSFPQNCVDWHNKWQLDNRLRCNASWLEMYDEIFHFEIFKNFMKILKYFKTPFWIISWNF